MKKKSEEKANQKKREDSQKKKQKQKELKSGIGLLSFIHSQKGTSQNEMKFYE